VVLRRRGGDAAAAGAGVRAAIAGRVGLVPTRANRMPTAASYLRAAGGHTYRAFKFDVLRIVDGMIAEITTFDATLFPAFGLPLALD